MTHFISILIGFPKNQCRTQKVLMAIQAKSD